MKDFTITVKGDTPGAVERRCTGTLTWEGSDEDLAKQQTAMLNCAEDPQVKVGVTTSAGLSAAETYSVQDRCVLFSVHFRFPSLLILTFFFISR